MKTNPQFAADQIDALDAAATDPEAAHDNADEKRCAWWGTA